jgi:hypothetical protein
MTVLGALLADADPEDFAAFAEQLRPYLNAAATTALLDAEAAARLLGIHPRTLTRAVREGRVSGAVPVGVPGLRACAGPARGRHLTTHTADTTTSTEHERRRRGYPGTAVVSTSSTQVLTNLAGAGPAARAFLVWWRRQRPIRGPPAGGRLRAHRSRPASPTPARHLGRSGCLLASSRQWVSAYCTPAIRLRSGMAAGGSISVRA